VVESQPSKLLVAGSIPVSRSRMRKAFQVSGFEFRQSQSEAFLLKPKLNDEVSSVLSRNLKLET
jgi:hypothetical protein